MLFDQKAVAKIHEAIATFPIVASSWEKVSYKMSKKKRGDAIELENIYKQLKERVIEYGGNKRFSLGNHVRKVSEEAKELSFYYKMTEEPHILQLILSLIRIVDQEESWVYQFGGTHKSDLWTADIGVNMAFAFSAIQYELEDEERIVIAEHIYRKAFLPLFEEWLDPVKRLHALDTMGHNWWMVCVAGAGVVLLLCGEQWENRGMLLDIITESMEEWFRYPGNVLQNKFANFGPDGDYIEFMGYLDYSLYHYLIFCELYYKQNETLLAAGEEVLCKLPALYEATIYSTSEGWKWLHFGDTSMKATNGFIWLCLASRLQDSRMLDYFARLKGELTDLLEFYFYPESIEKMKLENKTSKVRDNQESQHMLLRHTGIAIVSSCQRERDSEQALEQDLYFAIKTGEAWNHNHRDAGTFVLVAGGNEFIVDSGHCTYSKPQYAEYYCSSQAHNVVLHQGRGIPDDASYRGTKFTGRIPVVLAAEGYQYILADCTGPYVAIYERFYRHVLLIGGNIIMIDDLYAHEVGKFEWLLHVKGEAEIAEDRVTIHNGEKLIVENLYPLHKKYEVLTGYLHVDQGGDHFPEGDIAKITTTVPSREGKFINVFLTPLEIRNGTQVEKFGDESCLGVRLFHGGKIEEVYVNPAADGSVMHNNSVLNWNEVKTDGFIARICLDREGKLLEISLHNGSFLHYQGVCLFSTLLKCDVIIKYTDEFQAHIELSEDACCYFTEDVEKVKKELSLHSNFMYLKKRRLVKGTNFIRIDHTSSHN